MSGAEAPTIVLPTKVGRSNTMDMKCSIILYHCSLLVWYSCLKTSVPNVWSHVLDHSFYYSNVLAFVLWF